MELINKIDKLLTDMTNINKLPDWAYEKKYMISRLDKPMYSVEVYKKGKDIIGVQTTKAGQTKSWKMNQEEYDDWKEKNKVK
jgi:hypothetical protein